MENHINEWFKPYSADDRKWVESFEQYQIALGAGTALQFAAVMLDASAALERFAPGQREKYREQFKEWLSSNPS
jgi:hypothetical protein